jgi:hypothetical protein
VTEMSEDQLIDLWDIFSEYVPKANKEQLAMQYVKWCQDNGVDEDVLYAVGAEDPYLGEAVEDLQGKRGDDDDDWDEDEYSSDDEEWD